MIKTFLLLLVFVLTVNNLFAQQITIVDVKTLKPISEVEVEANGFKRISNKKGIVKIDDFSEGKIFFNHLSYNYLVIEKSQLNNGDTVKLSLKTTHLATATVSAPLRDKINVMDEPHQALEIDKLTVRLEAPATTSDLLQNTGQVLTQKSQGGGGSPMIRGFEANKLLLVIDGVRLNNAIYRSGHLQNSITIDPSILEKTDVIFGPSSVLYGSDALGGVIHFHTSNPVLADLTKWLKHINYATTFNSNNKSVTTNINYSVAQKKWGLLTSLSVSKFGDYKMGTKRLHGYNNWGLQPYYVKTFNGVDSMLQNSNASNQINIGYNQTDALAKFIYKSSNRLNLTLNFQYSKSSNINRFDKLNEYKNGELKYAEWYYGPQKRVLASAKLHFTPKKKWLNTGSLILSYQKIDEDRIVRKFKAVNKEFQLEDVNVFAINLDLNKIIDSAKMLFYGLEIQHNLISSQAYSNNINTTFKTPIQTRYPNGGSQYLSSGVYVEYKQQINPKLLFTTGLRLSYIYAKSLFTDTTIIKLPFNVVNISTAAPSGNLGFIYQLNKRSLVKTSLSSAYRAPNVDDYGKVFEKKGNTVIPTQNLSPEYALNAEISAERIFGKKTLTIGSAFYYTYLFNTIVRSNYQLNGQDSIIYNGELTNIQTNINTNRANIYGLSSYFKWRLYKKLFINGSYNYTKGIDLTNNTPLAHIAPQFGKLALSYTNKKISTALYSYYNFRKKASLYGGSTDNLDESPNNEGTPAWATLNYRLGYYGIINTTLQFAITNIFDVHYKQFASAISAPGRSFNFTVRFKF